MGGGRYEEAVKKQQAHVSLVRARESPTEDNGGFDESRVIETGL